MSSILSSAAASALADRLRDAVVLFADADVTAAGLAGLLALVAAGSRGPREADDARAVALPVARLAPYVVAALRAGRRVAVSVDDERTMDALRDAVRGDRELCERIRIGELVELYVGAGSSAADRADAADGEYVKCVPQLLVHSSAVPQDSDYPPFPDVRSYDVGCIVVDGRAWTHAETNERALSDGATAGSVGGAGANGILQCFRTPTSEPPARDSRTPDATARCLADFVASLSVSKLVVYDPDVGSNDVFRMRQLVQRVRDFKDGDHVFLDADPTDAQDDALACIAGLFGAADA